MGEIEADPQSPEFPEQSRLRDGTLCRLLHIDEVFDFFVARLRCGRICRGCGGGRPLDSIPVKESVAEHPHQPPLRMPLVTPGQPRCQRPRGTGLTDRESFGESDRQFCRRRSFANRTACHHRQHLLDDGRVGGRVGVQEFDRVEGDARSQTPSQDATNLVHLPDRPEETGHRAALRIGERPRLRVDRQRPHAITECREDTLFQWFQVDLVGNENAAHIRWHLIRSGHRECDRSDVRGVGEILGRKFRRIGLEKQGDVVALCSAADTVAAADVVGHDTRHPQGGQAGEHAFRQPAV